MGSEMCIRDSSRASSERLTAAGCASCQLSGVVVSVSVSLESAKSAAQIGQKAPLAIAATILPIHIFLIATVGPGLVAADTAHEPDDRDHHDNAE